MGVWWVGRIIAEVCPCPMTFSQARAVELLLQLFCQKTPAIPLKPSIQHPPKAILWVGGWVGPINIMECPIDVELLLAAAAAAAVAVGCVCSVRRAGGGWICINLLCGFGSNLRWILQGFPKWIEC